MQNQEAIDQLNSLIQINNDRIEGYETAAKETEETDLKALFNQFIQTSRKCSAELVAKVRELGGEPTEGTKVSGKFFRVWMDVKAALTNKDRHAILNSCEFGEDQALKTYKEVLEDKEALDGVHQTMVLTQYDLIKADHDTVKSMRDAVAAK